MSWVECPTPKKVRLHSRKEAKDFRKHGHKRASTRLNRKVRPYLCVCGFWHLGHLPTQAIRESREAAFPDS